MSANAVRLCSPHEAKKQMGVASSTVHKWAAAGLIHSVPAPADVQVRYPGAILVSLADVKRERDRRETRVSASQAAHSLDVAVTTVLYYCDKGYLPFERRGKLYEIEVTELDRFRLRKTAGEVCARPVALDRSRECQLDGCTEVFSPGATAVRLAYGKFCCRAHYALELKRRFKVGEWRPPMWASKAAMQKWERIWDFSKVAEIGRHHKGKAHGEEVALSALELVKASPGLPKRRYLDALILEFHGRDRVEESTGRRRMYVDPVYRKARAKVERALTRGYKELGQPVELRLLV